MNRTARVRALAIVAVLVAASSAAQAPAPVVHADAADRTHVTLLGDSTMAAMQWYQYDNDDADTIANNDIREIVAAKYDLFFSAESCRRIVIASCRGRFGTTPVSLLPFIQTSLAGKLGDAMVIMAGYDDPTISTAVDQVMAEAERQGVATVIWLTYRTGTDYVLPGGQPARDLYESHNAELRAAATRHASLHLLDWNAYSAQQPVSWFASDGIHLNPEGAVGLAHYITDALDADHTVSRCSAASPHGGAVAAPVAPTTAPAATRSGFVASEPVRVLDTRVVPDSSASDPGNLGAGRVVTLDLDHALPPGATEAVLSVTATDTCRAGYLTVFACGARPPTSTMNDEVGRTTAGMAITELSGRNACVFASTATDLVVDVIGAFTPGGDGFHPLTPTRWLDTRGGSSIRSELIGERSTGQTVEVPIRGSGGVPNNATAVWINLTIADPAGPTVLLATPGPCGPPSLASTVNADASRSTASTALVGIGKDGTICVHTVAGRSGVVVDVAGWFGPGGGLMFTPQPQVRLVDTRIGPAGGPTDSSTSEVATSVGSVTVLNAVAVDSTAAGYVSVRPCGSEQTNSLINMTAGKDSANITVVAPGANGAVCTRASVPAQLVVDQVGAFTP